MKIPLGNNNEAKQTRESAWFGQFVFWTTLVAFGFGGVEVIAFVIFGDYRIGTAGAVTLGYGGCLLIARELLRRGRIETAVTISCIGLLVGIVVVTLILPIAIPAITILPLVVVALALPYIQGRGIRLLVLASWGVGIFVAIFGEVFALPSEIPTWFSRPFRIGSIGVALSLAFLLMRQFTSRLNETLAKARTTNAELQNEVIERKQAEERFRSVVESAPNAIVLVDEQGRIIMVNSQAERFFGYERAELLGLNVDQLVPDRFRGNHSGYREGFFVDPQVRPMGIGRDLHGLRKDGSEFPIEIGLTPIETREGPLVVASIVDISERKQAEEALRLNEQRFRALTENSWDSVALFGADGTILYGSPSTPQILGYELDEFVGRNAFELIHKDDQAFVTERLTISLQKPGEHVNVYARVLHKNGSWHWLEGVFTNLLDEPSVRAIVNNYHDFTERKRAEERFKLAVEAAPNAIIMVNQTGKIVLVNAQAEKFFGYERNELIGKSVDHLVPGRYRKIHPEHREGFYSNPQTRAMGVGRDLHGLRKDGSEFPVEIGLAPIETQEGILVLATVVDITERKRAEESLKQQAKTLQEQAELLDKAHVLIRGMDNRITFWNKGAEKLYGWTKDEAIGKVNYLLLQTQFPESLDAFHARLFKEGVWEGELIHTRRDGRRVYVASHQVLHRDEQGNPIAILQVNNDITELKRAEEKLQRQNQRLKALREIDTAILSADSVENIVSAALSHIRDLIDCRRASLTLIDWGANEALLFDVRTDRETSMPKGARVPLARYQDMIQTLSQNQPVLINDLNALADPPPQIQSIIKEGLHSLCTVPLFSQSSLIGTFGMASETPGFFDEEKMNLGREVANQVAIAITQSNLLNALRELNANLEERVAQRTAELSQANALLNAMMNNIPDQIYFKDIHSRFIRNSVSQAKMMGLIDPAEAVGKSDFDFFPHAQRSFDEEQEVMRSGQPIVDLEEYVVWPDSRVTWVSTTKVPFRDTADRIIGIFGISRDITERKRAEEALRKAKDDMQAANKELESFSYSVSHDLRAPLRAIDGYSRILLEDYISNLDDEGKRYFSVIRKEAQRMGMLIDDLLAFSRLGRKEMRTATIDMQALVGMVVDELVKENERGRIDFQIGNLPVAVGDPSLIRQVWINLISNALKYTSKKERAIIEVDAQQKENEIVYYVRDNGTGFDMEYANKLFGVFQRLHSEREFEGTGVGLAIVQRVIHRHGGRVWAEAEVDKGATFHFAFPIGGES